MTGEMMFNVDVVLKRERFQINAKMRSDSSAIAIVGPSGAGKSTFLRILAGLERRSIGRVLFDGKIWQDSENGTFVHPWQRRLGYVPQDSLLIPTMTVFENLCFSGADIGEAKIIAERLAITSLLYRRPRMLSGGEKQRVSLGRALLAKPQVLLLDEPFSALDRDLRTRVAKELVLICHERRLPLILVSHDQRDVMSLAQEVWTFENGLLK